MEIKIENSRILLWTREKNKNLIKGINLEGLRIIGDPNKFAVKYFNEGIDEIIFMDAVASLYGRNNIFETIKKITKNIFIPISVGGGISKAFNFFENSMKNTLEKFSPSYKKNKINI